MDKNFFNVVWNHSSFKAKLFFVCSLQTGIDFMQNLTTLLLTWVIIACLILEWSWYQCKVANWIHCIISQSFDRHNNLSILVFIILCNKTFIWHENGLESRGCHVYLKLLRYDTMTLGIIYLYPYTPSLCTFLLSSYP